MGYTHFWVGTNSDISPSDWQRAISDCTTVIKALTDECALQVIPTEEPALAFNGDHNTGDASEPFIMPHSLSSVLEADFEFCKTYQRPYDLAVVACLAICAEAGLSVSSDGEAPDWEDGIYRAQEILNRQVICAIDHDPD